MAECQAVSTDRNHTFAEYPQKCVHELFESQVQREPNATAIVAKGLQLTYGELNVRANQLAHHLRKHGVGPETLVAVCLKRSPEMVIALLGVWKAGAAYVPLDSAYPRERLAFMCRDSGARVLLTDEKCKPLLDSIVDYAICLDSDWSSIAAEPTHNPSPVALPSDLAYVMYTSGSTGRPKGAMILHRGLVNYLWWAIKAYGVKPGGSVPVHSSISFDLTVTSLYTPLLAGAEVELLPEDLNGQQLLAALRSGKKRRSLIKITPAHLDLLNQLLTPDEIASVTDVFVIGGEALLAENLSSWRRLSPDTRLINEYGPTETVVGCCVYEVQPDDPHTGPVAIGLPIANTQLYVLDSNLHPVETGVIGELYVGGAGVARGYWNRPELTRELFLPDPFSTEPGARLYKTGDLASYRVDGILEYLGRADDQVKVLGYRIELGEIEAALASHASVQSCAVIARENTPGNKQLIGYVVTRNRERLANESLRDFLREKLPEYMVPARFVFLDALPLTENGKVDRKSLPNAASPVYISDHVPLDEGFIAPRTATERILASIWSELLNVERVGIHDDFFALGGHSLTAVKAVARIQDALKLSNTRLPLATFLQAPTIAELARMLEDKDWAPSWSSLVPIRASGSKPPLFLFHAHGGNVIEYHPLADRLDQDQPVYALQARGLNGEIVRGASMQDLAAAYISELRNLQPNGPYFLGGFCFGGLLAFEAAQQLTNAGQEVSLLVLIQPLPPDAMCVIPTGTLLGRWRYRLAPRLELEMWNVKRFKLRYLGQRCRASYDRVVARAQLAWDNFTDAHRDPSAMSMRYILRALADEHIAAAKRYIPRTYAGNTLLFRASKQVNGPAEELWWKSRLRGNVTICEVPGTRHQFFVDPALSELAKKLNSDLAAAQRSSATRRQSPPQQRSPRNGSEASNGADPREWSLFPGA